MTGRDDPSAVLAEDPDPRLREGCIESFTDGANDVVLVGVVHDHPASTYRVRRVVDSVDPAVLALELPPLALPLFEQYATDDRTPPVFGGEMSAAIQAAATDRVVGIDGPSTPFFGVLAEVLHRQGASLATAARTVKKCGSMSQKAARYRLGAILGNVASLRVEVDPPTTHGSTWHDPPAGQAADERSQIARANAMLNAFDASPTADACTEARERYMASRLATLRESGTVVAVVGMGHLESLATTLADDCSRRCR